jgi:sulfatase modifying factor 1
MDQEIGKYTIIPSSEAMGGFDPYRVWLGIPKGIRKPNYYHVLGIAQGESSVQVIQSAIQQRRGYISSKRGDGHEESVSVILSLIDEAAATLLVSEFKHGYDRQLGLHDKKFRNRYKKAVLLPNWMESRIVRVYGEGSGLLTEVLGLVAILFGAFALMAWFSFHLPWQKFASDDTKQTNDSSNSELEVGGLETLNGKGKATQAFYDNRSGDSGDLSIKEDPRAKNKQVENMDTASSKPNSWFQNSIGMRMQLISPGDFNMGCSLSPRELSQKYAGSKESDYDSEVSHPVAIKTAFYLGVHEVTVGQFKRFVQASNFVTDAERDEKGGFGFDPKTGDHKQSLQYNLRNPGFNQNDNHPVVNVSWNDAVAFCSWLSRIEGKNYRLPTEAEWEYCCRSKSTTEFSFGDYVGGFSDYGNSADSTLNNRYPWFPSLKESDGALFTSQVGRYRPNSFGIFDMHGNVWEWCSDWYGDYPRHFSTDPYGPESGFLKVNRGGGWIDQSFGCRSSIRRRAEPWYRNDYGGFRVAMSVAAK